MLTFWVGCVIMLPMSVINQDKKSLMVKCACHNHAVEIMIDDLDEDCVPQIYLGIWTFGQRPMPLRWKDRLRWIWCLIRDGRLHGDDVVLNHEDALTIAKFLADSARKAKRMEQILKKKYEDEQSKRRGNSPVKFIM